MVALFDCSVCINMIIQSVTGFMAITTIKHKNKKGEKAPTPQKRKNKTNKQTTTKKTTTLDLNRPLTHARYESTRCNLYRLSFTSRRSFNNAQGHAEDPWHPHTHTHTHTLSLSLSLSLPSPFVDLTSFRGAPAPSPGERQSCP